MGLGKHIDFDKRVAAARKRVASMDKSDGYKERGLRTICTALEAGLKESTTDAAYDALVMLSEVCDYEIPGVL